MRVMILTQNYIPEPDPKMHILASGLVKRGHTVNVITGYPNYPQGKIYEGYRQKLCSVEIIDGVRVVRIPLFPDRSRSFIKRSLNYLSFPVAASLLGPFVSDQADVILVYHPPATLGIPAIILSFLKKAPFIFEIQDMWPETLTATGMVSNEKILKFVAKLSMATYKRASAITVISPGFKRNLVGKGVPEEKIHVIYNWAYEGDFTPPQHDKNTADKMGFKDRFNILYAGNMGPAQGLQNVIEAASMLTHIKDLQFVLIGSGVDRDDLERRVREKNLGNVRFLPRMPMDTMPSMYAMVDAVMVHLTDDPLFEITIPGKTQSCLLSGKPVIVSVNGDAANLILEAGAGLAAKAMSAESLACAAEKLYRMPSEERKKMGETGRRFYYEKLAPEVAINKYEKLFYNVTGVL